MIELAALILVLAYLAHDRHQTARILATATPDLEALIAANDRLCQRLQAPDVAVAQHAAESVPSGWAPPAVGHDDDEAFMESRLSKDELAVHYARLREAGAV